MWISSISGIIYLKISYKLLNNDWKSLICQDGINIFSRFFIYIIYHWVHLLLWSHSISIAPLKCWTQLENASIISAIYKKMRSEWFLWRGTILYICETFIRDTAAAENGLVYEIDHRAPPSGIISLSLRLH